MSCFIFYINNNEIANHFTLTLSCFAAKGAIHYVTIAMAVTISLLLIILYRIVIINIFCNTVQLIAWKLVITRTKQT